MMNQVPAGMAGMDECRLRGTKEKERGHQMRGLCPSVVRLRGSRDFPPCRRVMDSGTASFGMFWIAARPSLALLAAFRRRLSICRVGVSPLS